jgi:two-component system, cell cycle sensor histidine kinase and response regulator CckA
VRVGTGTNSSRAADRGDIVKALRVPSTTSKSAIAPASVHRRLQQVERREWLLWSSAILVTLLLTVAIVSFLGPGVRHSDEVDSLFLHPAIRGLVGLVLLFDIYTIYLQYQIVRIRRQVMEQDRLFRLITENAGDMIAVVDVHGNRLYNSPSYKKILGYSLEELQHTSSFEQIHPEDQPLVREAAEEARLTGFGRRIEYRMRHRDGTWRYLESTASAIRGKSGEVETLVLVNRDITARRRLEEQFRQAQKMEAVGRLSGGIAHDFNNLLGVIIGYAELVVEHAKPGELLHESGLEILKGGRRAASLTSQLLAFSRQQVLEPKALDLNDVVSDAEKMLRRVMGEDIEFTTRLTPSLGTVKADPGQIEQILMNLVVNARDAMQEGGQLIIETANIQVDQAFAQRHSFCFRPGAYVLLAVTDTGAGMEPEIQNHIFEPFFTTKGKDVGTGLGLATVYGVVKQSGGYIEVLSELGKGTTFKIYLPRISEPSQPAFPRRESVGSLKGGETILLVEDEAALRALTRDVLRSLGYCVLEAENGAHALALAETTPTVHLLLTDIVMPGINGRILAHKLAERYKELKIVFMSGYTGQGVGNSGEMNSKEVFLVKPFTRDALGQKVRSALDTPIMRAAL